MDKNLYDDIFQIIDEPIGDPPKSIKYIIKYTTGSITGKTDEYGNTEKLRYHKLLLPSVRKSLFKTIIVIKVKHSIPLEIW